MPISACLLLAEHHVTLLQVRERAGVQLWWYQHFDLIVRIPPHIVLLFEVQLLQYLVQPCPSTDITNIDHILKEWGRKLPHFDILLRPSRRHAKAIDDLEVAAIAFVVLFLFSIAIAEEVISKLAFGLAFLVQVCAGHHFWAKVIVLLSWAIEFKVLRVRVHLLRWHVLDIRSYIQLWHAVLLRHLQRTGHSACAAAVLQ